MDSEEMASKLLAGVPSVFWHNIPESHLLVARELPGVQGAEELEGCFLAHADFDAGAPMVQGTRSPGASCPAMMSRSKSVWGTACASRQWPGVSGMSR